MVNCLLCNKKFGMITESHMKRYHNTTCKKYAKQFNLRKGKLNPHHSKNMRGKSNPRYGLIMPKETREKIRLIHKTSGRFNGKSNPMFGKTHTLAVRKRLSEYNKLAMLGEKNPFYGKKHSKETKKKISEVRIKKGLAKGKNNPLFGRGHTEETKAKMSKFMKELHKKHPEKHINARIAKKYKNQKNKKGGYTSEGQSRVYNLVKKRLYKDAILNHPIQTAESLFFADIAIPSIKLNIEYDGGYWHLDELKDDKRDVAIILQGWQVIRVKEEIAKNYNDQELLKHVQNLIEENKFQVLK